MTAPNKPNEFSHAEYPAPRLPKRSGYPVCAEFPVMEGHHD